MRDFTLLTYRMFLESLGKAEYQFKTFSDFLEEPGAPAVILRHDVDYRKHHSLEFAKIQHEKGIQATYYFRIVPQSFDEKVIREIYEMGHEIGYHYEDMDLAGGDPHQAIKLFERHLEKLRKLVPVSTICMHGSPRSKYDNRDLWKYFDYRDYGIIGEPYFDIDFKDVFYLTDTGRRWDGHKVSIRDKVENHFDLSFHATHDVISSIHRSELPTKVMFTFHPEKWMDDYPLWLREKYFQKLKNGVKYCLLRLR